MYDTSTCMAFFCRSPALEIDMSKHMSSTLCFHIIMLHDESTALPLPAQSFLDVVLP